MQNVVVRILCSAARTMWQKDPNLGDFTHETFQHELNLQYHYANELRSWFPWLDCDFNVSKGFLNREQPDIVLHERGINTLNFLAIEVKRQSQKRDVPADLRQIRRRWFGDRLHYRFGAVVILEDDRAEFEVRVLERATQPNRPLTRTHANMEPMALPDADCNPLRAIVDQMFHAEKEGDELAIAPLAYQLDMLMLNRFGFAA